MDDVPTDGCKHVAATAESTLMKEDKLDVHESSKLWSASELVHPQLTSLQLRTVNSLKMRKSLMRRFISLSLSEKPTRMKSPVGCRATLKASSWNSLHSSTVLMRSQRCYSELHS